MNIFQIIWGKKNPKKKKSNQKKNKKKRNSAVFQFFRTLSFFSMFSNINLKKKKKLKQKEQI